MNYFKAVTLAYDHRQASPSAELRYQDALTLDRKGDKLGAVKAACDSLRHSVGVYHNDYRFARALQNALEDAQ